MLVEGVVESVCSIGSAVVLLSKERLGRVREMKNNIKMSFFNANKSTCINVHVQVNPFMDLVANWCR